MKKAKVILPITLLMLIFLCASKPTDPLRKKNYIELSSNITLSKYEVTNGQFKIFLKTLEIDKPELYVKYYPDTSQWINKFPNAFTGPWKDKYFAHPAFNNYPVVNITKEAAEAYCTWLTLEYSKKGKKSLLFRLPTENEWEQVATTNPICSGSVKTEKDHYYANLKYDESNNDRTYDADGAMITATVDSYPDNMGAFNLIGNVSEITFEGKIVGGSWANTVDESLPGKQMDYTLPDPRVGFRIVMEIKE